jgi:hypothetical protein
MENLIPIKETVDVMQKLLIIQNTLIAMALIACLTAICIIFGHDVVLPIVAIFGGLIGLIGKALYDSGRSQ